MLATLNDRFRHCLSMTKMLNAEGSPLAAVTGLTSSSGSGSDSAAAACNLTADRILYQHAVSQCQEAALDELLGSPGGCVQVRLTLRLKMFSSKNCKFPQKPLLVQHLEEKSRNYQGLFGKF